MSIARTADLSATGGDDNFRRILGMDFFCGSAQEAIARMSYGGLLVVPAAPALKDLASDVEYRESLLNADLAITDSAFMVLIWNQLQNDNVKRVSGLEYLRQLAAGAGFSREPAIRFGSWRARRARS